MELSLELIDEILGHFDLQIDVTPAESGPDFTYSIPTPLFNAENARHLLTCSLVNKYFHASVLRILYSDVTLYLGCPKTFHLPFYLSFSAFNDALKIRSQYQNHFYIQRLRIIVHSFRLVWDDVKDVREMFERISGLRSMEIKVLGEGSDTTGTRTPIILLHAPLEFVESVKHCAFVNDVTVDLKCLSGSTDAAVYNDSNGEYHLYPDEYGKRLKLWRHSSQKAFLSRHFQGSSNLTPEEAKETADSMDSLFTILEKYEPMTANDLKYTKIGKVMRHIAALDDALIPFPIAEHRFRERAQTLYERWIVAR